MANLLQTLIPLISFIALFLHKVHSKGSFTHQLGGAPNLQGIPGITYQGDARDLPSGKLSLAGIDDSGNIKNASVGRILRSEPMQFWEKSTGLSASFRTTIKFVIKPSRNGAAEGVAFFIAPVGTTIPDGSVGGHLGIYGKPTTPSIFAVEFDTNHNGWDPKYHHVGINIQSRASSNVTKFNAGTGEEVIARINYDSNTRTITVVAATPTQSAELSYEFDLKTVLPERVQVGLTSSTGWYVSAVGLPEFQHWQFSSSLQSGNFNGGGKNKEEYIRQIVSV